MLEKSKALLRFGAAATFETHKKKKNAAAAITGGTAPHKHSTHSTQSTPPASLPHQETPYSIHNNMEVNFAISMKAPPLNIDLTEDVMWGFRKYCEKFGGKKMNQAGLKALQCVPIAHAALAVKQGEDMKSGLRNTAMSRSMQEIAVPGWIKVIEAAIKESERELVFPVGFKDALYYTTLGTGAPR